MVGKDVFLVEIGAHGLSEPRRLGRVDGAVRRVAVGPQGRFLATGDTDGQITLWDVSAESPPRVMQGRPSPLGPYSLDFWDDEGSLLLAVWIVEGELEAWVWTLAEEEPRLLRRFDLGPAKGMTDLTGDHVGRRIVKFGPDLSYRLWSMAALADAEPLSLRRGEVQAVRYPALHPQGRWLATSDPFGVTMWPLARPWPSVIRSHREDVNIVLFAPDGRWLASASGDGTARLWPLEGNAPPPGRVLLDAGSANQLLGLAISPDGELFLAGSLYGAHVLSLDGQPLRSLPGFQGLTVGAAFSPDGSLAAAVGGVHDPAENVVRVWDVASGDEVEVLEREERLSVDCLRFTADGRIIYASESGLRRWNLETGEKELLVEGTFAGCAADVDGKRLLLVETAELGDRSGRALFLDLETGSTAPLATHGDVVTSVALDPSGSLAVTGDNDGVIRVGPVTGEEPHLLLGHEHAVWSLAVDPRGRWVSSGGADATVRLWPMPDLSRPPLHALPRDEFIAKLKTLTNLRVVRDEESATGWTLTHDPFPGWETVPTW